MKHQSGRSMVEILGVLAIIGVLSVGGLAAYNYAMDKKVVNDLMYDMELATTEIWTSGTTGSGDLGEEMDVSVLGENHPNIRVRKLQHMENGEIVLDEADGEITEEDVAAVENGEEPAFSIEIHDITVAQCVQLLRNQDKLNTPFLLEDSDGNVFDPENGDDPQDFCERVFGGDDPVAFGLISNAYAKRGGFLSIFYRETPEEKWLREWQRKLEDCANQPKDKSPYIIKGKLCGSSGDCDCYNPEEGYFMTVDGKCVKTSVSMSGSFVFSPCVGSEEDRKRAIEYIKITEVKDLTGMELVFKGVWFGPQRYDNPKSIKGFHAMHVFANVPCIIKDADGSRVATYVSTKCSAFDAIKHAIDDKYQGCCPPGYVAQVGSTILDDKFKFMDGKFAECTSHSHCADKGEGKEYCDILSSEPRCVPCPEGTSKEGKGYSIQFSDNGEESPCRCEAAGQNWDGKQCVCPGDTKIGGSGEYVDGDSGCACPFANQVFDAEHNRCVCADGYVLNAAKTACEPIKCKEYEIWQVNSDGITYCVPCGDSDPVSDGNNRCTTCVNKYGTEKPYWDEEAKQCKPCPADKPKWNGSSCEKCPEGTVYGQTSDGTMDCVEKQTDECTRDGDCGPDQFCVTEEWLSGQSDKVKDYFKDRPKNVCLSKDGPACAPVGMWGCKTDIGGIIAEITCGEGEWYHPCPGGTYNDDKTLCPMAPWGCLQCPPNKPYSYMQTTSKDKCFSCPANAVAPEVYGGSDVNSGQSVSAINGGEYDCFCKTSYYAVNDNKDCCLNRQIWKDGKCVNLSCPANSEETDESEEGAFPVYHPVNSDPNYTVWCKCDDGKTWDGSGCV